MLTIQAIILSWLAIVHDLSGVAALPGASTIRHDTSNIDTTSSLIANGPYDISVPEDPDHFFPNNAAAPVGACSASLGNARCSDIYNYPASACADLCTVMIEDTAPRAGRTHRRAAGCARPRHGPRPQTTRNPPVRTVTLTNNTSTNTRTATLTATATATAPATAIAPSQTFTHLQPPYPTRPDIARPSLLLTLLSSPPSVVVLLGTFRLRSNAASLGRTICVKRTPT